MDNFCPVIGRALSYTEILRRIPGTPYQSGLLQIRCYVPRIPYSTRYVEARLKKMAVSKSPLTSGYGAV
jgi:hypothetical protein